MKYRTAEIQKTSKFDIFLNINQQNLHLTQHICDETPGDAGIRFDVLHLCGQVLRQATRSGGRIMICV
jgi:hypothetical protein